MNLKLLIAQFTIWLVFGSFVNVNCSSSFDFNLINLVSSERQLDDVEFGHYTKDSNTRDISYSNGKWVATLNCSYDYAGNVDVSWHVQETESNGTTTLRRIGLANKRDNEHVSVTYSGEQVNSTLQISDFNANGIGLYTCVFGQPLGFYNITSLLEAPPILNDGSSSTLIVESGDDVSISCTSFTGTQLNWRLPQISQAYDPLVIDSNDDGVNSTTTLKFKAETFHTSNHYQCCSTINETLQTESNSGFPSMCTTFSVVVKGVPTVSMDVRCVSQTNDCFLSCYFFSYPPVDINTIVWTNCGDAGVNCVNLSSFSNQTFGNYVVQTRLHTIRDSSSVNYLCSASNQYGPVTFSRSITSINYFSPIPIDGESIAVAYPTSLGFSANITCSFSSNPKPTIYWIRQGLTGQSLGLEIISPTGDPNIKIQDTTLQTLTTISLLRIANYSSLDKATYICVAANDLGGALSKPLQAFINMDTIELEVENVTTPGDFFPGDTIEIYCWAHAFPPPNIIWTIIAEFPVNFKTETVIDWTTGNTTSTIIFESDAYNNILNFECLAYNDFSPTEAKYHQLELSIYHVPIITNTKGCNPDDFANNAPCTLACDLQSTTLVSLKDSQWRYFIKSPSDNVPITDSTSIKPITPYRWRMELTLANYSAWNYQCWSQFEFNHSDIVYHKYLASNFKISPESQYIELGGSCENSEDCATLNANCNNQLCECLYPDYIPLDESPSTLACLSAVGPDESCITSKQCYEGQENFFCDLTHTCQCGGEIITIAILQKKECINGAHYSTPCKYDEECRIFDPLTYCSSDTCVCLPQFTYNVYTKQCAPASGSMSTSGIVVISISCCLVAAIIFTLLAGYLKRRRDNRWAANNNIMRNRSEIISEISGVPYEHLDDSTTNSRGTAFNEDVALQDLTVKPSFSTDTASSSHYVNSIRNKETNVSEGRSDDNPDMVTFY